MLKYINGVEGAPEAQGAYSQAVIVDDLVFISGQLPIDPQTGKLVGESMEEQVERVMKNLLAILGHMGSDFSHVVKTTIYTTDLSQIHVINGVYTKWMGSICPARSLVQVSVLPLSAFVEIEMVAALGKHDELMLYRPADEEAMQVEGNIPSHEMKR